MEVYDALKILGAITLQHPSRPHLVNLPPQCKSIQEVQEAYKVVEKALNDYDELKKSNRNAYQEGLEQGRFDKNMNQSIDDFSKNVLKTRIEYYYNIAKIEGVVPFKAIESIYNCMTKSVSNDTK